MCISHKQDDISLLSRLEDGVWGSVEFWSVLVWLLLQSNLPEHQHKKLQFFFLEPATTVPQEMTECLRTGTFCKHQFPGNKAFQRLKKPVQLAQSACAHTV